VGVSKKNPRGFFGYVPGCLNTGHTTISILQKCTNIFPTKFSLSLFAQVRKKKITHSRQTDKRIDTETETILLICLEDNCAKVCCFVLYSLDMRHTYIEISVLNQCLEHTNSLNTHLSNSIP